MTLNPWIITAALAALIGTAFSGYEFGLSVQRISDQVAADHLKIAAAAELQAQTVKVAALNQTLADASAQAEKDSLDHAQTLKDAAARSDAAIAAAGGLRDPGRSGIGRGCPTGHASGPAADPANTAAGPRLSDQLTRFLLAEADRADHVVVRLQACESYAAGLRAVVNGER